MSEPPTCDPDEMKRQQYNPEFIAHVKEGHAQQVPLTAESLMALAYQMAGKAEQTAQLRDELADIAKKMTNPLLPATAKFQAQAIMGGAVVALANTCALTQGVMATLASEMARFKLKEIVVE